MNFVCKAMWLAFAACCVFAASGCTGGRTVHAYTVPTGGDARHGREVITSYGCGSCHTIFCGCGLGLHCFHSLHNSEFGALVTEENHSVNHHISSRLLWFGFAAAATAWLLTGIADVLITWQACPAAQTGGPSEGSYRGLYLGFTFALLAITLAAGIISFRNWRRISNEKNIAESEGMIAGEFPNSPENMVRWLQSPQSVEPGTAMPTLGLTDQQARDAAAYLYTLQSTEVR